MSTKVLPLLLAIGLASTAESRMLKGTTSLRRGNSVVQHRKLTKKGGGTGGGSKKKAQVEQLQREVVDPRAKHAATASSAKKGRVFVVTHLLENAPSYQSFAL